MINAPIVLFTYNRLKHTRQTIEALQKNELSSDSHLYIFSDAPRSHKDAPTVEELRKFLRTVDGFKSVTLEERTLNWGIEDSVVYSVSDICKQYGKVIVLEDDIVTSPHFLKYMNSALDRYEHHQEISFISGYNHPSSILSLPVDYDEDMYFVNRNCSYGWGTWYDSLQQVKWTGLEFSEICREKETYRRLKDCGEDAPEMLQVHLESKDPAWDIRITLHQCRNDLLTLYPVLSYVDNIGFDDSGLHCQATDRFRNDLSIAKQAPEFPETIARDPRIFRAYKNVYRYSLKGKLRRFLDRIFRKAGYKLVKI